MVPIVTSRIAARASRVAVPDPRTREKCASCGESVAGIHSPWGTTKVCANASCLLDAQQKDSVKALMPAKSLQNSTSPQYCGAMIAYKGNGKWVLGFAHNDEKRTRIWYDDISYYTLVTILDENHKNIQRLDESEIFGT